MYPVRLGFALAARGWIGTDALWLSFPVGSTATMLLAIGYYLHGGWRRGRMGPAPDEAECLERAQADAEPGGALSPRG
jgi:hypothetical protein